MPAYKKADPSHIVTREEVERMLDVARDNRERALISFLYIFGPRPSEVLEITGEDVDIQPTKVTVRIPTKKIRKQQHFEVVRREITVRRPHPRDRVLEEFVYYARLVKESDPTQRLFGFRDRTSINKIVERVSVGALGYSLAPYNFRHSRLTKLARAGATIDELMYWKGARSVKSVSPYLHGRPIEVELKEIDRD